MAEGGTRRTRRRGAILLAGLLAGIASAAIVDRTLDPRPTASRAGV